MRARSTSGLCAIVAVSAAALLGCGGDGTSVATETPLNPVSTAESLLGVDLLPPDGVVAAASALSASDLPPDASALGAEDLPPTS